MFHYEIHLNIFPLIWYILRSTGPVKALLMEFFIDENMVSVAQYYMEHTVGSIGTAK